MKLLNTGKLELQEKLSQSQSMLLELQAENSKLRLKISQLTQDFTDASSKLQIIEIEKSEQDSKLDTTSN